MPNIRLKNLFKIYPNGVKAVNDFSMEINDGEFITLVGPSGCGKSTLLRMIAGLEEISGGEIFIGENCVNDKKPSERNVSMVFQNYALYPHLTARENMSLSLKMRKINKTEIEQKIQSAAQLLGIEELLDRRPPHMSGGQQQRVALGRAIVKNPDIFLLDEPLSNLDAALRTQMRLELIALHKKLQSNFIYVTHDQVEAMTMGQRVVVMDGGVVQQIDTPKSLYRNPANIFVAEFIGTPKINLFDAQIENGNLKVFKNFFLPMPEQFKNSNFAEGACYTAGLRAEAMHLCEQAQNGAIPMEVEFIETIGNDSLLYLKFNEIQITAKCAAGQVDDDAQQVYIVPNTKNLLLFDKATGKNLEK